MLNEYSSRKSFENKHLESEFFTLQRKNLPETFTRCENRKFHDILQIASLAQLSADQENRMGLGLITVLQTDNVVGY